MSPTPLAAHIDGCKLAFSSEDIAKTFAQFPATLILNTSNPDKQRDFRYIFADLSQAIVFRDADLAEIKASPLQVIAHKASQFNNPDEMVLVEDTSLDVDGVDIGINVRWLQASLKDHIGKRAIWRALMGVRVQGVVYVFEGKITGHIAAPRGDGFGFDPVFIPDGSSQTLAEYKPHHLNARAIAAKHFANRMPFAVVPVLENWQGPWQEAEH